MVFYCLNLDYKIYRNFTPKGMTVVAHPSEATETYYEKNPGEKTQTIPGIKPAPSHSPTAKVTTTIIIFRGG